MTTITPDDVVQIDDRRYQIAERLGSGAMATVFRCTLEDRPDVPLVLKVAAPDNESSQRALCDEVLALERLNAAETPTWPSAPRQRIAALDALAGTRRIVALIDADIARPVPLLVQEYAPMRLELPPTATLADEPRALQVAVQIAEVIKLAHREGLALTDFKPLEKADRIRGRIQQGRVMDLRLIDWNVTAGARLLATNPPIAPSEERDERTRLADRQRLDLVYLAGYLFAWLCGTELPFDRDRVPPQRVELVSPGWERVSRGSRNVLQRALQVDEARRYTRAADLHDDLVWWHETLTRAINQPDTRRLRETYSQQLDSRPDRALAVADLAARLAPDAGDEFARLVTRAEERLNRADKVRLIQLLNELNDAALDDVARRLRLMGDERVVPEIARQARLYAFLPEIGAALRKRTGQDPRSTPLWIQLRETINHAVADQWPQARVTFERLALDDAGQLQELAQLGRLINAWSSFTTARTIQQDAAPPAPDSPDWDDEEQRRIDALTRAAAMVAAASQDVPKDEELREVADRFADNLRRRRQTLEHNRQATAALAEATRLRQSAAQQPTWRMKAEDLDAAFQQLNNVQQTITSAGRPTERDRTLLQMLDRKLSQINLERSRAEQIADWITAFNDKRFAGKLSEVVAMAVAIADLLDEGEKRRRELLADVDKALVSSVEEALTHGDHQEAYLLMSHAPRIRLRLGRDEPHEFEVLFKHAFEIGNDTLATAVAVLKQLGSDPQFRPLGAAMQTHIQNDPALVALVGDEQSLDLSRLSRAATLIGYARDLGVAGEEWPRLLSAAIISVLERCAVQIDTHKLDPAAADLTQLRDVPGMNREHLAQIDDLEQRIAARRTLLDRAYAWAETARPGLERAALPTALDILKEANGWEEVVKQLREPLQKHWQTAMSRLATTPHDDPAWSQARKIAALLDDGDLQDDLAQCAANQQAFEQLITQIAQITTLDDLDALPMIEPAGNEALGEVSRAVRECRSLAERLTAPTTLSTRDVQQLRSEIRQTTDIHYIQSLRPALNEKLNAAITHAIGASTSSFLSVMNNADANHEPSVRELSEAWQQLGEWSALARNSDVTAASLAKAYETIRLGLRRHIVSVCGDLRGGFGGAKRMWERLQPLIRLTQPQPGDPPISAELHEPLRVIAPAVAALDTLHTCSSGEIEVWRETITAAKAPLQELWASCGAKPEWFDGFFNELEQVPTNLDEASHTLQAVHNGDLRARIGAAKAAVAASSERVADAAQRLGLPGLKQHADQLQRQRREQIAPVVESLRQEIDRSLRSRLTPRTISDEDTQRIDALIPKIGNLLHGAVDELLKQPNGWPNATHDLPEGTETVWLKPLLDQRLKDIQQLVKEAQLSNSRRKWLFDRIEIG
jgi:hypothetical protein